MSLLDRVRFALRRDLRQFRRFCVGGRRVGWVGEALLDRLRAFPDVFRIEPDAVHLAPALQGLGQRSRAVAAAMQRLRQDGLFPGWRDESYPVGTAFDAPPLLAMERAAARAFGVQAYCVQLNGIVRRGDEIDMWIARRSLSKPLGPGKLDQIVGGGVPLGVGLMDNLVKECAEEASIPADIARRARPVGTVTYLTQSDDLIDDGVLFNYDLELPADFLPCNTDGEVEEFFLWPVGRVLETLAGGEEFLFDVALCLIDFLVRHGLVGPDHPDYVELVEGLRSGPRHLAAP